MHPIRSFKAVAICLLVMCNLSVVTAEIMLPAVVGDHMVLQHGQPVPIWGWADPGETVSVAIAGQSVTTEAGSDRHWQVMLPKLDPRTNPIEMRIQGSSGSRRVVKDILVGEVWFCTGPSNIFWPVSRCDNAKQEIAAANYPLIRFFTVQRKAVDTPQADCKGEWFACSSDTVGAVSGVGYFFSRKLHHDLNAVPIGILQSFWGGSRIEAWTSIEALKAQPELKPILDWWASSFARYDPDKAKAEYDKQLDRWQQAVTKAEAEGAKKPAKPKTPMNPFISQHRPACLYNGMVAPVIPYGIRGAISYQGLGNLFWAQYTQPLLRTMISDWRSRWGQGPFPFGMVQPAPYPCDSAVKSNVDAYTLQREAQLLLLDTVPATGVAPTMDIGDLKVLHFSNKQEVGRRMALWALATVYGRDVPYSGPMYRSMTVEGNKIRIHFTHADAGLTTNDGRAPSHFMIAGRDKQLHPAVATIDVSTVLVFSERVPEPVAVRFAFHETDVPNLINREGLPALLFRTDVPLTLSR